MATKKRRPIHGGSVNGALRKCLNFSRMPVGPAALPLARVMRSRFTCCAVSWPISLYKLL